MTGTINKKIIAKSRIIALLFILFSSLSFESQANLKRPNHLNKDDLNPKTHKFTNLKLTWLGPSLLKKVKLDSKDTDAYGLKIGQIGDFTIDIQNTTRGDSENTVVQFNIPNGYLIKNYKVVDNEKKITTSYMPDEDGPYDISTGIWTVGNVRNLNIIHYTLIVEIEVLAEGKINVSAPIATNSIGNFTASPSSYNHKLIPRFDPDESHLLISLGSATASRLYKIRNDEPNYPKTSLSGYVRDLAYNSMGYHPKEHYLYAVKNTDRLRRIRIYLIDAKGEPWDVGQVGIPDLKIYQNITPNKHFAGEIDPDGNFYTRAHTDDALILKIDLEKLQYSKVSDLTIPRNADFAWNGGFLYTVASNGVLYKIDVNGNPRSNITAIGKLPNDIGNRSKISVHNDFGALYGSSNNGYIFGSTNDGKGFYRIMLEPKADGTISISKQTTLVHNDNNDGAHDVTKELKFPTDLGINVTSAQPCIAGGSTLTYNVRVWNDGNTAVSNTKVLLGKWIAKAIPGFVPNSSNFSYTFTKSSTRADLYATSNLNDLTNPTVSLPEKDDTTIYSITFNVTVKLPYELVEDLVLAVEIEIPDYIFDPDQLGRASNKDEINIPVSVPLNGIILSKNVVCIGEAAPTLSAIKPGEWSSSNTSVASVTPQGIITLHSAGYTDFSFVPTLTPECTPENVRLTVNPMPPSPSAYVSVQPSCINPVGQITVTAPDNTANLYNFILKSVSPARNPIIQTTPIFNNLAIGEYELSVAYVDNGCASQPPIKLSIEANSNQPASPTGSVEQPTCNISVGEITITSTLAANEVFVFKQPDKIPTEHTSNFFGNLPPGEYLISVRDTLSKCESSPETFTLAIPPIIADAGKDFTITCNTDNNGGKIGTAAVSGYTYSWTSTSGPFAGENDANPTVNPSVTTTYTLTVTNPSTGCTATDVVVVTVDKGIGTVAMINNGFTITCIANIDGAQIGTNADPNLYTFLWDYKPGLDPLDATNGIVLVKPTITTTYNLRVTNISNGCYEDKSVTVVVNNNGPESGLDTLTITCSENTDGGYIGSDANPKYTYRWKKDGLPDDIADADLDKSKAFVNPAQTRSYILTVTDTETGCVNTDTVIVEVNKSAPSFNLTNAVLAITCNENIEGVTLSSDADPELYTFKWENTTRNYKLNPTEAAAESIVVKPYSNATFELTVTSIETGCYSTKSVNVVVNNTPPESAVTPLIITCSTNTNGGNIGKTAKPNFTYSWKQRGDSDDIPLANLTEANPFVNPSQTRTYTLISTDTVTGCSLEENVTVTVNKALGEVNMINEGATITCVSNVGGALIGTSADANVYTFTWTANTEIATGDINKATINVNPTSTTTYNLRITNISSGCYVDKSVEVIVNNTIPDAPTATPTHPICKQTDGSISINAPLANGTTTYTYTLTGTNPVRSAIVQTETNFTSIAPGTYSITATNNYGCTSTPTSITINEPPATPINVVATTTQPTCGQTAGAITVTAPLASGTTTYTYTLTGTNPAFPAITQGGTNFASIAPGTYSITATNNDGCISSAVSITINERPTTPINIVATTTQPTCGQTVGSINITAPLASGTTTYNYTLTGTNPLRTAVTQAGASFTDIAPGEYIILATNNDGCTSDPVMLTINTAPPTTTPMLTATEGTCMGDFYTVVYASNGKIDVNIGSINGNIITVPKGMILKITATDIDGCATSSISVTPPTCGGPTPCIAPKISAGQPACATNGFYGVSLNYADDTKVRVSAGILDFENRRVYNIPVGTDLDVIAGEIGCETTITVHSPSCTTDPPCSNAALSVSAGICLGSTYTIYFDPIDGVTVNASVGTLGNGKVTNIPIGTDVTLTASFNNGCADQKLTIPSPSTTKPLLTVATGICIGNFYTVTYTTNGKISVNTGTISGNTITVAKGTKLLITATSFDGCATNQTEVKPLNCDTPPPCTLPKLSSGQPACTNDGFYMVALNYADGVKIRISAGVLDFANRRVSAIPVGTDLIITAGEPGCETSLTIKTPNCISPPPCTNVAFSASAGICLGKTYNVYFTPTDGVTVSTSEGLLGDGVITNIPIGTNVTLSAFFSNGCPSQKLTIPSPSATKPLLTVESGLCISDGFYTVTFSSNGIVSTNAGRISGNTINVPAGVDVIITATATDGCATNQIGVQAPKCYMPPGCEPLTSTGQPECEGNGTYGVAINYPDGVNIYVSAGTFEKTLKRITGVPVGTDLWITTENGGCATTMQIFSPKKDECTPTDPPCTAAAFSVSAGICLGATYTVYFVPLSGVTVTASVGVVGNGIITNIPITMPVTITATFANGCAKQVLTIAAPKCPITPAISIVKSGVFNDENKNGFAEIGETITFRFLIKNIGNTALTSITINDKLRNIVIHKGAEPFTLAPGQETTTFFTATYRLQEEDITNGFVKNEVTVFGENAGTIVKDDDDVTIPLLIDRECAIMIYNTVTPNGDNKNDFFRIDGIECYKDNTVKIYNRWGVLVFDIDSYDNQSKVFVGKSEGRVTFKPHEVLPSGVYYYIIKYRDNSEKRTMRSRSGYLYLSL